MPTSCTSAGSSRKAHPDDLTAQLDLGALLSSYGFLTGAHTCYENAQTLAPAGPIAPLDILYGHRPALAGGNLYMAHRCGFTRKVLVGTLQASGFATIASKARGAPSFDLWALASKSPRGADEMQTLAAAHFPS